MEVWTPAHGGKLLFVGDAPPTEGAGADACHCGEFMLFHCFHEQTTYLRRVNNIFSRSKQHIYDVDLPLLLFERSFLFKDRTDADGR